MAIMGLSAAAALGANEKNSSDDWPRLFTSEGYRLTIHEPQIDSWDGFNLNSHAAVAVQKGKQEAVYGVVIFSALTLVDKSERMVTIEDLRVKQANFPSVGAQPPVFMPVVERAMAKRVNKIALDRLEAFMTVTSEMDGLESVAVRNPVPVVIFAQKPSILVYIDGAPKYALGKDSDGTLSRVINTRVLLLRDAAGRHYLHLYDGFMEAPSLFGPWRVSAKPPAQLKQAVNAARKQATIDLLEGDRDQATDTPPSLAGISPDIYIATEPTELFVTDGEPNFASVAGTQLLYVTNSSGSIFKYLQDNKTYILASGRWFRAVSIEGPWEFVPANNLPADFAHIPDESPKENVKASVPGTPQAKEALLANSIPQTAKVSRDDSSFIPLEFDGAPQLVPIEGMTLDYVINCAIPVIRVDYQTWYALENGVWFIAFSLDGPWRLADSVHADIYSIPPSSPLHYVTYVKVYKATPQYVYVGYTPGYFGTVVSDDVIVYGTGYYYPPWVGAAWYGAPITYGLGSSIAWTPWTGWGFSFGFGIGWGWGSGWYYPPAPWWGPYYYRSYYSGHHHAWGPGGWAYTTGNYYRHGYSRQPPYRSARVYGNAYNSRHGTMVAGQRGAVQNVFRGAPANSARTSATTTRGRQPGVGQSKDRVFGTREGKVYRATRQGNWETVNASKRKTSGAQPPRRDFSREQRARQTGQQRYQSLQGVPRQATPQSQMVPSGGAINRQGGFSTGGQGAVRDGGASRGGGGSAGGSSYRGEGRGR